MKKTIFLIVVLAAGLVLAQQDSGRVDAAENVSLLWISSVLVNEQFCTGIYNPVYHGSDQAADVFADTDGTMCSSTTSCCQIAVKMRTWGFASTAHNSLTAFMFSGEFPGGCDYIEARTIENGSGKLRGTQRYLHARGQGGGYGLAIPVAASPGATSLPIIGNTVYDGNCPWTGHHVHQGFLSNCGTKGGLQPVTIYPVWHPYTHVNRFDYTEGLNC
ncbi:MAG: hypothetical protein WEB04_05300 [Dehalococcoidia bacterium]